MSADFLKVNKLPKMSGTTVKLAQFTKFGRKIVAAARNYGYETLYIYFKILWF